jgi:hypothetical protein
LNETNQTPYKFYSVQFRVHSAAFLSDTYLTYSLDFSAKQRHNHALHNTPLLRLTPACGRGHGNSRRQRLLPDAEKAAAPAAREKQEDTQV